jgi:hypothetical protein
VNLQALTGLAVIVISEAATLAGLEPFASWNTPIGWTGFIVFADGVVFQQRGTSWLRSAPREFAFLAVASIPLWLVFEFFNLFLDNWHYVGLPENRWLRALGYGWAFATIWPAIFEGADLMSVWRGSASRRGLPMTNAASRKVSDPDPRWLSGAIVVGLLMLAWPIVYPSRYLAAPVWLGFILVLDPINWRLGEESLVGDLYDPAAGGIRIVNLMLSGFLCGVVWEFLNYWSRAKWHYTVPIMENVKIFEMPLPGYFGFPAFALECFTMYVFVRALCRRMPGFSESILGHRRSGRETRPAVRAGRPVAW